MSGHTPGPWVGLRVSVNGKNATFDVDSEVGFNAPKWEDLSLVASAPDLLEAVETSLCPGQMDPNRTAKDCYEAGTCGCSNGTAIAKARGENT